MSSVVAGAAGARVSNRVRPADVWDASPLGMIAKPAALLCFGGLFLQIILSPQLLDGLGFSYTDNGGPAWQKIHPGTIVMLVSLLALVVSRGNPIATVGTLIRDQTIYCAAFGAILTVSIWVMLRSGANGLGTLVDTHWTPFIAAIVLGYAPRSWHRRALLIFAWMLALNSFIGICEGALHQRLFAFLPAYSSGDSDTGPFRASALRGHPLNNALFTAFAIFILLGVRMRVGLKTCLLVLSMASLVAFGGRGGLIYALVGVTAWGMVQAVRLARGGLSLLGVLLLMIAVLLIPLAAVVGLDALINSSIGVRLATTPLDDASANARLLATQALGFMTTPELWLGVSMERILQITYLINLQVPITDIENPWILLLLFLGGPAFAIWLLGTGVFVARLLWLQPLTSWLAVLGYFATASTSNSFGRKDSTYCLLIAAVVCTAAVTPRSRSRRQLLAGVTATRPV